MKPVRTRYNCPICKDTLWVKNEASGRYRKCDCYNGQLVKDRLTFADIPKEFKDLSIKEFNIDLYKNHSSKNIAMYAKKICTRYVKEFETMSQEGKGLYLYSKTKGSGKTRMAASIGNAILKYQGTPVKFTTTNNLLNEIKGTYGNNAGISESKLLESITRVDVLILDDIGVQNDTAWSNEKFYSILNQRMISKKVTIFTANVSVNNLGIDDRIKNRIHKMALPIRFPEESVREYIAQSENQECINRLLG